MPATAELAALLHACMLEPDSAEPRRVVGDWLEENGESEAEEALAGLLRRPGPEFRQPRWWALVSDEERPVANRYKSAWLGGLAGHRDWGMDRGLFTLRCEAHALLDGSLPLPPLRCGRSWFARLSVDHLVPDQFAALRASPWLRGFDGFLDIRNSSGDLAEGLADPAMASLTGLGLDYSSAAGLVPALCRMPHWRDIAALSLSSSGLSADALEAMADAPLGQGLRFLVAERNDLPDAGLIALARSGSAATLRGLEWDYNDSGDKGTAALASMPELRHLSLTRNRGLTLAGLETLLGARCAPRLLYLSLAFLDLGDPMCRMLATAGSLHSLARLDVSGDAGMTLAGIQALVASDQLPALRWLGVPTRLKGRGLPSRKGLQIA